MLERVQQVLSARSAAVLLSLESRLDRLLQAWLLLAGLACAVRIATAPVPIVGSVWPVVAPYVLFVLAPFASTVLALRWFARGDQQPQPALRLAQLGRWNDLTLVQAKRHRLYGTSGIMVSLLVGLLMNVPVRAAEYLVSMPPVTGTVPSWLSTLHLLMTFDVVLFSSLYMVAFVAALRRVPLFPRLLAAIWIGDLTMQLVTAELVTGAGPIPPMVAEALRELLQGNMQKVLISVALWLPYLLLSRRVNVTYRHRVVA